MTLCVCLVLTIVLYTTNDVIETVTAFSALEEQKSSTGSATSNACDGCQKSHVTDIEDVSNAGEWHVSEHRSRQGLDKKPRDDQYDDEFCDSESPGTSTSRRMWRGEIVRSICSRTTDCSSQQRKEYSKYICNNYNVYREL